MSYTTVAGSDAEGGSAGNVSRVVVEPCSSSASDADAIPQRWTVADDRAEDEKGGAAGGQITAADGRCLTAALSPPWFNHCPGLVLAPCSNSSGLAARQRWRFDRGVRTISGIVSSSAASASGLPPSNTAVSVVAPAPVGNGGDWYSVALFEQKPESLCSGVACQNETAHHATTPQMWYLLYIITVPWDESDSFPRIRMMIMHYFSSNQYHVIT